MARKYYKPGMTAAVGRKKTLFCDGIEISKEYELFYKRLIVGSGYNRYKKLMGSNRYCDITSSPIPVQKPPRLNVNRFLNV